MPPVEQYQHHYDITYDSLMTPAEAIAYDDTSASMLQKAVLFYKAQGKVVAILSHSFGSYLSLKYLDNYGINDVDKMVVMAGKLKTDTLVSYAFFHGYNVAYDSTGQLFMDTTVHFGGDLIATAFLVAGMTLPNHLDLLQGMDLSKLFFQAGANDSVVGWLTQPEIDFLNNTNATLLNIPNWGHPIPGPYYLQQMVDFIRSPNPLAIEEVTQTNNSFIYYQQNSRTLQINSKFSGNFTIYSINGQIIYTDTYSKGNNIISIPSVLKGIYIVNIVSKKENYAKIIVTE